MMTPQGRPHMTETDWLNATEPHEMLKFLRANGPVSGRKLRLFECACCRRLWKAMTDERSREAVLVAERWADGLATAEEAERARHDAWDAADEDWTCEIDVAAWGLLRDVACDTASGTAALAAARENHRTEESAQAAMLRCI